MQQSLNEPLFKPFWEKFFADDLRCFVMYHDYWIKKARESNIPVYFFRFEELLITPEPVLKDMFRFILGVRDIDGTIIEKRIKDVIRNG